MTETNEVAIRQAMPATIADAEASAWQLMRKQAEVLVKSGMLPNSIKTPEAAMAIMQTGREFGLQPMQSFRNIDFFNGQVSLRAHFLASLVNRHCATNGGYLKQAELTHEQCTIEYKRPEWPEPQTFTFSLKDAEAAGLKGKDNWKKHPREMMYARAVANACRMGWPELVAGVYDPDELSAVVFEPEYTVREQPSQNGRDVEPSESEVPPESSAAMRKLHAVGREYGHDHDTLHGLAVERFGVESMRDLSDEQLAELTAAVEGTLSESEQLARLVDAETGEIMEPPMSEIEEEYLASIYAAESTKELQAIGKQLRDGGVSHPALREAWQQRAMEVKGLKPVATVTAGADRHTA